MQVSKDIADPEEEEPLVWEYLWNDPLPSEQSAIEEEGGDEDEDDAPLGPPVDGFVANHRRGTGHMFSDDALDAFLKRNGLSHVIRAHEVKQAGFQVFLQFKNV